MATSQLKQAILDLKIQCMAVPGIQYCALFNNQVKEEEKGHTFNFLKPAILIEIKTPQEGVQLLGMGVTVSDIIFRFSIVHEQLNAEYNEDIGASGMDENLDVYDLRDLLKVAL